MRQGWRGWLAILLVPLSPRHSELQDEDDVAKNHDELEAIGGEAAAQPSDRPTPNGQVEHEQREGNEMHGE